MGWILISHAQGTGIYGLRKMECQVVDLVVPRSGLPSLDPPHSYLAHGFLVRGPRTFVGSPARDYRLAEVENEASPPSSRQGRTSPVGASLPWILPLGARFSRGKLRCGKFAPSVRMTEWPRSRPRPVWPICNHGLLRLPNGALGTPPLAPRTARFPIVSGS